MTRPLHRRPVPLAALALWLAALPVHGAGALPPPAAPGLPAPSGLTLVTATPQTTDRIVRRIEAARDFCARLADRAYVIDCLAAELGAAARDMPGGDYNAAGQVLRDTARELRKLAEANADPAKPRGRVRVGKATSSRALTPVRRDARVTARAAGILQEAETRLIRAAEGSARRMVHYQRIAAAIGSAKVLLRSA